MRIVVVGGSGRVGAKPKMRQEDLAREPLIPHTILLSTQFFEFMPTVLQSETDPRAVIADPRARYFGAKLGEDTRTPDEGAIIGVGRFEDWLKQAGGARALN